jgi:hypothetical protein
VLESVCAEFVWVERIIYDAELLLDAPLYPSDVPEPAFLEVLVRQRWLIEPLVAESKKV